MPENTLTKVWFSDGSVIVEVETPFDAETLYVLWKARNDGARVWVPCKVKAKMVMLDIAALDADRTFKELLIAGYRDTLPPQSA